MKQIVKSPIDNNKLEPYISCKDYTVSRETFLIFIDNESELLITTPQPNEEDLGKYYESDEYISHSDTKKSVVDKLYHWVRNYTVKKKVKLINSFNSQDKMILDIGAGTGDFLAACKNDGWKVTGVEPNEKAREIVNCKLSNLSADRQDSNFQIHDDLEKLNSKTFDVITMWHVLEHVPNLNEYVSNLKSLLKPNGTLIIAVPNFKSYDANYYKEFWAAYDVPRHLWHFSKKSISELFAQEKMKVEKVLPMKFDSFYVSLLSEKYKFGKSNMLRAFWIGLKSNLKAKSSKEYSSHIYIIKNQ
ncbi:class I SAM-dependent methyltransferase [Aureibaculum sp. 2210JD6-5]|uniref:class I SAM-dependent methyltransferase n=1 Tax=Aureibaculum sp. 2210JD6-5 TaxID=3103957 RepID=UPI002AAE3AD0|nr:class I SAM-dependent methyltransferase [Aureibaculum sp. 2210JD6-5]MDY7394684.1 class I SAM-dependent methyltransferase [Aureibaculum sp. 2210JD6-5]